MQVFTTSGAVEQCFDEQVPVLLIIMAAFYFVLPLPQPWLTVRFSRVITNAVFPAITSQNVIGD